MIIADAGSRKLVMPLLALCLMASDGEAASTDQWRAIGNEPGWSLTHLGSDMVFETDFGGTRVTFPVPPKSEVDSRTVQYTTAVNGVVFDVTIKKEVCVDSMSGMPRPERVSVTFGDRKLSGCGGEPASLLQGADWIVTRLAGEAVLKEPHITLTFSEDGRVSGNASCNRFGTEYKLTGEGLQFGKSMSSMMACEPDIMKQEQLFMELLERVSRFSIAADGALVLHSDRDRTIVSARP